MSNSRLYLMIALSVLIHLGAAWILNQKDVDANSRAHGVVSIDYIQHFVHEEEPPSLGLNSKSKIKESAPEQKHAESKPQAIGDPNAIAKESDAFIGALTKLIDKNKIYPREAIDREEEGKVIVSITLNREGRLLEVKVEGPSPFELLNNAAVKTVEKVAQFPIVPDILAAPIHLHVPLVFKIERR